jgi:Zn-finger nucleic acid-binding protein
MDCPRCKLSLKAETYEGHRVELCQSCWGVYVETGELVAILASHEYHLSPEEKKNVLEGKKAKGRGSVAPIACPKCRRQMERLNVDPALSLVIDRCPQHGMWLDTGEIKTIEAVVEGSQEIGRLLVQKIIGHRKRT